MMKVLVVNCGSSSIKYRLYEMPERTLIARGQVERIGQRNARLQSEINGRTEERDVDVTAHTDGMRLILQTLAGSDGVAREMNEIDAVGHRVVHGGEEFTGSVVVTADVIASLERYSDLAPLHNPPNLIGIRAAMAALPDVPQVACFDTAFHATIPTVAYMYALPYALYEKFGIRRYGFHGTSHRYVARRAAELLERHKYDINCITAHLGNGCSMTAVQNGRSVDTSMGLTPLEGLTMGTRSGDFDPAILFYLNDRGYDMAELNRLCNKESGLLGVSGESNDMRTLLQQAEAGSERARLAIDIFVYRIKKYIGSYMAVLGHVDALVFTGGIGEHSAEVRAGACAGLEPLGIDIDTERNLEMTGRHEGIISEDSSRTKVLVVPTDEEAAIAADTHQIVCGAECMLS